MGALLLLPGIGPAFQVIASIVSYILSCKTCMIVLGLITLFVAGDIVGRTKANKACRAAQYQAQLQAAQRDTTIAKAETDAAKQAADALAAENDSLTKKVADYVESINKLAPKLAECRRGTTVDSRRLRDIAK